MTNKNVFTNAEAMQVAAKLIAATPDNVLAELTDKPVEDFRSKFNHMEAVSQPKDRKREESPAAKANKAKAIECEEIILAAGKPVDWKFIAERCNGITSSQKATAILTHAISNGNIERIQIKGKVYYQQAGLSSVEE